MPSVYEWDLYYRGKPRKIEVVEIEESDIKEAVKQLKEKERRENIEPKGND